MNEEDQRLLEEHRKGLKQSLKEVQVVDTLLIGLQTDGAHHKQWALWRISEILGLSHFTQEIEDKGIAP